jgi:hypothetical protein
MRFLASITMQALLDFEVVWMKFLFLPAVTIRALVLMRASVLIRSDEAFSVPILAHVFGVVEYTGLPPVILPIMSVNTNVSFMIILSVRTPYSFKVKEIEVHVRLELFNQLY